MSVAFTSRMITNERVESALPSVPMLIAEDLSEMTEAVLLVEADSTLRQLLAQRLRLAGFAPVSARTWAEALHLMQLGTAATLIFLGPSVPLTEGCSEPDIAHIPIIALPSADPCEALARTLT